MAKSFNELNKKGNCFTCRNYNSSALGNKGFKCQSGIVSYTRPDDSCGKYSTTSKGEKQLKEDYEVLKKNRCCYVVTAITKLLGLSNDCEELIIMSEFRENFMDSSQRYQELVVLYDEVGPILANALYNDEQATELAQYYYDEHLLPVIKQIKNGENKKALVMYIRMMKHLYTTLQEKNTMQNKETNYQRVLTTVK